MFKEGMIVNFILLSIMTVGYLYILQKIKGGYLPEIRNIPAIDALKEYTGRAVEMGRPMHFTSGDTSQDISSGERFPNVLSGLRIAGYLASLCGKMGADLICSIGMPTILPLAEDIVKSGFIAAGVPEKFTSETVQFTGGQYAARTIGNIARYNIACNVLVGDIGSTAWTICEAAASIGATQIGGTPNDSNMVVLVVCSDYTFLGDEQYTAGAVISKNPPDLASIVAMDFFKAAGMVLLFLSFILLNMGNNWIINTLRL